MTNNEEDRLEAGVPELAVSVLTAANRRAAQAGHPLVLVKNGSLVRIDRSGTTVLKKLPARKKVSIRSKRRSHE